MPTLNLVRGLPGSGKSTYAKSHKNCNEYLFEADQFFETPYGYKWDPNLLSQAHTWCKLNTLRELRKGHNVWVANTFTTQKELVDYFNLVDYIPDLTINVIELYTQFKSIHNVPDEAVQRMKDRWQYLSSDSTKNVKVVS